MEISPADFVSLSENLPVLDVRSPGEYDKGNVPGAVSFPLFTNTERAEIGTMYKRVGRQPAFERGLELVGPKIKEMVVRAQQLAVEGKVLVHCWRGGMRSQSVAQLLTMSGLEVKLLKGGYKAFRNWVLEKLAEPWEFRVLGGMTGSGKTRILHAIRDQGAVIVDLEALADHRGSAFGHLSTTSIVTQQQFENQLAIFLHRLPPDQPVWVEDESPRIGKVVVPHFFHQRMLAAPLYLIEVDRKIRIQFLKEEYGTYPKSEIRDSIDRLSRQLGGLRHRRCLEFLDSDDIEPMVDLLLDYYDKFYRHSLKGRHTAATLPVHHLDFDLIARELLNFSSKTVN